MRPFYQRLATEYWFDEMRAISSGQGRPGGRLQRGVPSDMWSGLQTQVEVEIEVREKPV